MTQLLTRGAMKIAIFGDVSDQVVILNLVDGFAAQGLGPNAGGFDGERECIEAFREAHQKGEPLTLYNPMVSPSLRLLHQIEAAGLSAHIQVYDEMAGYRYNPKGSLKFDIWVSPNSDMVVREIGSDGEPVVSIAAVAEAHAAGRMAEFIASVQDHPDITALTLSDRALAWAGLEEAPSPKP